MSNLTPFNATSGSSSPFDAIRQFRPDGIEFWSARDLLMGLPGLGYVDWRNAEQAIRRAMKACRNSGQQENEHFVTVTKQMFKGGQWRQCDDYELSRLACLLADWRPGLGRRRLT